MSLYKQYETNSNKETTGVEIEFPEAADEQGNIPAFAICRMGGANKSYAKALEAATRPYRRQIQLGTMKNEVAEKLFMEVFVDTVLKGWKNVKDRNGNLIEFSRESALILFNDLPEVYQRLQEEAQLVANFRNEGLEEEAKN